MNLDKSPNKPKHTLVELENVDEACNFVSEGLGLFSVKGLRLSLDVVKARVDNQWPVELTVSDRRLRHAADRMSEEAARLGAIGALPGFGEYPDAVENELALRTMADTINARFKT